MMDNESVTMLFFNRRYYQEVDRELYICCQENASQSTVEMAFKLLFGWPG